MYISKLTRSSWLLSIFTILLNIDCAVAQSNNNESGLLGQVIMSMLDPDKFKDLYGSSWVLMDGRNTKGTDLAKETGISHIPDARGYFLRGMNYDGEGADPDTKRKAGSIQKDAIVEHTHNYSRPLSKGNEYVVTSKGKPAGGPPVDSANNQETGYIKPLKNSTVSKDEIRPKNIALYIYIKVNNGD